MAGGVERRLVALEQALHGRDQLVTVTLADGSKRRVSLPACIPILSDITDIEGDGGERNGKLADLLRGLLYDEL